MSAPIYIAGGGLVVSKEADLGYATGNNAITFNAGNLGSLIMTGTGFSSAAKNISLVGNGTLDVGINGQASASAVWGGLISGPGNLALNINGTLTLTNPANTYTGGTLINGGTLVVAANSNNNFSASASILVGSVSTQTATVLDATQLTAAGGFQLHSGQLLAGWGTVKPPSAGLIVTPGSTISAGDGATETGKLTTTGTQIWDGGGTYVWKLNLLNPGLPNSFNNTKTGATWDELTMSALTLAATPADPFNIQVVALPSGTSSFNPTENYRWVAAYMPSGQAGGNLANAFVLNYSGFARFDMNGTFSAAFDSTDDPGFTDLVISYTAVPEPSALMLLGAGAAGLVLGRRRRRA